MLEMKTVFEDGSTFELDLVVGAEGVWSLVRKHILKMRYIGDAADKKWIPSFQGGSNIYGISRLEDCASEKDKTPECGWRIHMLVGLTVATCRRSHCQGT